VFIVLKWASIKLEYLEISYMRRYNTITRFTLYRVIKNGVNFKVGILVKIVVDVGNIILKS